MKQSRSKNGWSYDHQPLDSIPPRYIPVSSQATLTRSDSGIGPAADSTQFPQTQNDTFHTTAQHGIDTSPTSINADIACSTQVPGGGKKRHGGPLSNSVSRNSLPRPSRAKRYRVPVVGRGGAYQCGECRRRKRGGSRDCVRKNPDDSCEPCRARGLPPDVCGFRTKPNMMDVHPSDQNRPALRRRANMVQSGLILPQATPGPPTAENYLMVTTELDADHMHDVGGPLQESDGQSIFGDLSLTTVISPPAEFGHQHVALWLPDNILPLDPSLQAYPMKALPTSDDIALAQAFHTLLRSRHPNWTEEDDIHLLREAGLNM